jgi:glucose-6-phosphate dehydrogenase assembly protein OpcA
MDDVWAARDTTPEAIESALRRLLTRRRHEYEDHVPARVLNLVVIVDREFRGEIENRLERVGRFHPSRLVLCSVEPGRRTIDAWAGIASDDGDLGAGPHPGRISVTREHVELTIGARHLRALDTIVDPLLVADLATMVWAPHGHTEGIDSLRRLAQIVLLDTQDQMDLAAGLERACELARDTYVVDLAWLRSTPWRERVAAAFDPPALRRALGAISAVTVHHRADSVASAVLFCGWLASRLGWRPEALAQARGRLAGRARTRRQEIRVVLEAVDQNPPGLAGVTIETASGELVGLDRSEGGLKARRRARDGREQEWTVLGASRGEAGILGEGVRQALLRDPTYGPALAAARIMVSG